MRSGSLLRSAIVSCSALLLCGISSGLEPQATTSSNEPTVWPVRDGRLTIDSDSITYYNKRQRAAFIPIRTADVKRVCYDAVPHARGPSAWQVTKDDVSNVPDPFWDVISLPFIVPTAAVVHSTTAWKHFVTLYWEKNDSDGSGSGYGGMSVEPPKDRYIAMLSQLQKVTTVEWTNMVERRFPLYQRYDLTWDHLSKQTHDKFDIYLNRRSRVGSSALPAGTYPAMLKETAPDEGMLYIFRDAAKKYLAPVALVHVKISASKNFLIDPVADYNPMPGDDPFREVFRILTPTHALSISPDQPYAYDAVCPVLP